MATFAKFVPLFDNVLLRRAVGETVTKGGIHVPSTAVETVSRGEVVAVGEGRRREDGSLEPIPFTVGDEVLFKKYTETEVKVGEETLILVAADAVLGRYVDHAAAGA